MDSMLIELISKFGLSNEFTDNLNIWTGHAAIGGKNKLGIEEAKQFLSEKFGSCLADSGTKTPEWVVKSLEQWHAYHPFQNVRELDQPLFVKKLDDKRVLVAVIWPWQIKKKIASLMVYEGELLE